jgi:hypothetical protein
LPVIQRSYEREDFVFNPLHYLAVLEQKIGALDQAAPLAGWALPAEVLWFGRSFSIIFAADMPTLAARP